MPKFPSRSRVIFTYEGKKHRGRVTRVEKQNRRIVTDTGKRLVIPVRRLKTSPDRALILETRLDRSLRSRRSYAEMLKQWFHAYGIEALHERVHTVEALRRFLQRDGRNPATRFIHIIAHGVDRPGAGAANLELTFEDLDLVQQVDVFAGLDGKILLFSSCEVGADRKAMETIKEHSGAAAVLGYRYMVEDSYTNLAEAMLYDQLLCSDRSLPKAIEAVADALKALGARLSEGRPTKPVLVAY